MAEMKTRAAAAFTALALACAGTAIADGSATAVPTEAGQAGQDAQVDQASRYRLFFADNFNGRRLSSNWMHRSNQGPRRLCSRPDPRLAFVSNGTLKLQVRRDASRKPNVTRACPDGQYLNGMIGTDGIRSFQYGKFSARIKFHGPKGAHGAFWLQSPSTEVDVIEYFGRSKTPGGNFSSYVHRPRATSTGTRLVTSGGKLKPATVRKAMGRQDPSRTWHTYTVVWTPSEYRFSIDGVTTLRVRSGISSQPTSIILSLLSSYYELPNLKRQRLPLTMQVDWVKVWKR